ncbi:MAG: ABC transporter permease [Alphaproteobacteria bacterium]|nr:ABC transporter permease [Alphaproteobacteria bacterium]
MQTTGHSASINAPEGVNRRLVQNQRREIILFALIALMIVLIGLRAPQYLALTSVDNLLTNAGFLVILVLGQLPVLLTRGIDLSQAAVLAFCGMLLAMLSQVMPGLPAVAYILLALVAGGALGAINGVIIAFLKIPPIIMTLGTMSVYRGLVYILSDGAWVSSHELSDRFKGFPGGQDFLLPNIFWVAAICAFLVWIGLSYTRAGRNIYAVGGNPIAARYAGIAQRRCEVLVYVLSGALAGLCGYLWTARFAIAYTQAAEGREFAIIAACVIGGVSIAGGRGSVVGAILGAFFIAIVETALPFLRVNPFLQLAIIGSVILFAVAANARAERRPGRQILRRGGNEPMAGGQKQAERAS